MMQFIQTFVSDCRLYIYMLRVFVCLNFQKEMYELYLQKVPKCTFVIALCHALNM